MNLIVIVADSLRFDHVGCCGSPVKTPNIDALAAESAVLDQAYAENLPTMPCRAAWWLGRYLFTRRGWQPFEREDNLLAEYLYDKGFTSAFFTDTYHMHKPGYNCGRGFDTVGFVRGQEYDPWIVDPDVPVDLAPNHRLRGDETDERWARCFEQYLRNASTFRSEADHCAPRLFTQAAEWLESVARTRRDKLFLWVDSFSPHEPWDPPEPYRSMYDPDYAGQGLIDPVPGPVAGYMTDAEVRHTRSLYAGVVTLVDRYVGMLLDALRRLGLYENSLIVFTSDHGEPFGEHGIIRKARPWNYEELAHVPLIIRHPGGIGAGRRFGGLVQPPDLRPTVLEALGLPVAPGPEEPDAGTSLMPLLKGETPSVRDFAVTAHHRQQWAIRTDRWSYHLPLDGEPPKLFDRRADPGEQRDVLASHGSEAGELELKLLRFAASVTPPGGTVPDRALACAASRQRL
jgi:arylsulfatase A-like enzyme